MKNKIRYISLLMAVILATCLLTGCGSGSSGTDSGQASDDGQTAEAGTASNGEEASDSDNAASAIDIEIDEDLVGNNGYFVQYKDKVYFHAPTEEGMNETALWGNFANTECGETALFSADVETGEVELQFYDYCSSKMAKTGDLLMYAGKEVNYSTGEETDTLGIYSLTGAEYDESIPLGLWLLGADDYGHYVVGYYFNGNAEDEDYGYHIQPIKDGNYLDEIKMDDSISFVGIAGDELIYSVFTYVEGSDGDETCDYLYQINMVTGEINKLGTLPGDELAYGSFDQFEYEDGCIYMTYGFYEGTGSFYSGSYNLKATLGEEDSLEVLGMNDYDEESVASPAFYVENGEMITCDGIPMTAAVVDDDLGYYDEKGNFVAVESGFGTLAEDEDNAEPMINVDVAELLGDYIYYVQNVSYHMPEYDVGWRYAYMRETTNVRRINIKTAEIENLVQVDRAM